MKHKIAKILLVFTIMLAFPLCAEEAAIEGHGEEKAKKQKKDDQQMKSRSDSAISQILQLPEVKKWKAWIESRNDGSYLDLWGEGVKQVEGSKCWGVAVARKTEDDSTILARFYIMQTGLEIWVEQVSHEIPETISYFSYETWRKKCKPTENSAGSCKQETEKE